MEENNHITTSEVSSDIGRYIIIIICFALAILDMTMLRTAISDLLHISNSMASMFAFILATAANFCAFMWGRESGQHSQAHSINKYSVMNFVFWTLIGIFYMVIRIYHFLNPDTSGSTIAEIIQMLLLAILYISTGLTISAEARKIYDKDTREYKKLKKEFFAIQGDLASEFAQIQENLDVLSSFDNNFSSLNKQYKKIYSSIQKSEKSVMADIVGKMLDQHPEVTPAEAHKVMDDLLQQRKDNENSKIR